MKRKTNGRIAQTFSLSLPPKQRIWAAARAQKAGVSFSRYVQLLVAYDQHAEILDKALVLPLNAA